MAGLAALLTKSALDAALAGTAAKGTMDMNKKKEEAPSLGLKVLGDGSKTKASDTKVNDPQYKRLSQAEKDDLFITLVEGGLSTREAMKVITSGYISEDIARKLSKDAIKGIEGVTGIPMAFPTPERKDGGTPPVTGTTVKKQTRTETPEGEVRETTTTFDGNSGIEKSSKTEIPEIDLSKMFPNIEEMKIDDISPNNPAVREWARKYGISPEEMAKKARARYRTHDSLRGGIVETKTKAADVANQANAIHGRTIEVEPEDVMPSHMTRAEQNQERHAGQERLAREILRNEARAKDNLLHKDSVK